MPTDLIFDGDQEILGEYIREIADMMGLRDWLLGIADDPPDEEGANAQVSVPYGRKTAMIHFPLKWAERDPEGLRQTVVHELVHCHLWSIDQRMCDVASTLGSQALDIVEKSFRENLELAVDAMAYSWSQRLPLPILDNIGVENTMKRTPNDSVTHEKTHTDNEPKLSRDAAQRER